MLVAPGKSVHHQVRQNYESMPRLEEAGFRTRSREIPYKIKRNSISFFYETGCHHLLWQLIVTNDITYLATCLANVRFFCPHCTIPRERGRDAKYIWAPESWRQSQSASQGVRRQVHLRHEGPLAPQVLQGLQTQPCISKPGTRVGVVAVRANSFDYLGLWHRSKWPLGDRGDLSLKILPQKQGAWNLINKTLQLLAWGL